MIMAYHIQYYLRYKFHLVLLITRTNFTSAHSTTFQLFLSPSIATTTIKDKEDNDVRASPALLFILSPHVESHFFNFTPALLSILSLFLLFYFNFFSLSSFLFSFSFSTPVTHSIVQNPATTLLLFSLTHYFFSMGV